MAQKYRAKGSYSIPAGRSTPPTVIPLALRVNTAPSIQLFPNLFQLPYTYCLGVSEKHLCDDLM